METPISNNPNFTSFQQASQPSPGPTVFTPAPSPKKLPAKNILLAGVLILVLAGVVLGFNQIRSLLTKADSGCTPSNLQEANLTPNSIEITFQTDKACLTEIAYGNSADSLFLKIPEDRAALNHRIKLSPLLPSTTYYYQILAEGKNVSTVRSFLTKMVPTPAVSPTAPPPIVAPTTAVVVTATPSAVVSPPLSGVSSPSATPATSYTQEDFIKQYGTANAAFDFDKNGVVNSADWFEYQKNHQQ